MNIRPYQDKVPCIGNNVFIDETAIIIGDVVLGDNCSVWPYVVIRGDVHSIQIGNNTNIQDGCVLHVSHIDPQYNPEGNKLIIGNDVTIGHKAMLHGCTISDRVLIGMGSIILDNVVIDSDVIIGAGTVVPPNKKLNSGYLYVGNPARQVRPLIEDEKELLRLGSSYYITVKDHYLQDREQS